MADGNGNGNSNGLTSRHARDVALWFCLAGVVMTMGSSYYDYPKYETGVTTGLMILSNVISFLLGMKSALSTPLPPQGGGGSST